MDGILHPDGRIIGIVYDRADVQALAARVVKLEAEAQLADKSADERIQHEKAQYQKLYADYLEQQRRIEELESENEAKAAQIDNLASDRAELAARLNALGVALGTQKAVMRVAKEALETVIDEWPHEWRDVKEFYNECMEAFKALDAALGFEG